MDDHECPDCNLQMKSAHADDVLWVIRSYGVDRQSLSKSCSTHLPGALQSQRDEGAKYFELSFVGRPPLKQWEGALGPVDEWDIEGHVLHPWTEYQRDLIAHASLHGLVGWDDRDPFGKRWNRASLLALMAILKEDKTGEHRAILTEAGEEIAKRLKEREQWARYVSGT